MQDIPLYDVRRNCDLKHMLAASVERFGDTPGAIPRGRNIDELTLPGVPEAIPSDLLERRYDIREAEQVLVAANARIGAARALYFPAITLAGFLGTSSKDLSDLFTSPSRIWSYAGTLTVPVFTAGAIAGTVQATEGVRVQALCRYQKAETRVP